MPNTWGMTAKLLKATALAKKTEKTDETSDPDADWGKHETKGVDSNTGKAWSKINSWFGYGHHLIADTKYEIPVGVHVTPASHSEHT